MRGRARAIAATALAASGLLMAVGFAGPARPAPVPGQLPRVVMWGDSIAAETSGAFQSALAGQADVEVHAYPGDALCDWLPDMRRTVEREHVDVAVLSFAGNGMTACTRHLTGGALRQEYRDDGIKALHILGDAGTRVLFARDPVGMPAVPGSATSADMVGWADGLPGAVDTGQAVSPGGTFAAALPCLPAEGPAQGCRDGRVAVRSPDRVHLFPDGWLAGGYSSGAYRLAQAEAATVRGALGA